MIRHGSPPYLECSSRGDRRLSAFYAGIKGRSGATIEEIFQTSKMFADGTSGRDLGFAWRAAKGRRAVNAAECALLYSRLWDEYIAENPHLLERIRSATGLSDLFGQPGHCCQATELWRIRNAGRFDHLLI